MCKAACASVRRARTTQRNHVNNNLANPRNCNPNKYRQLSCAHLPYATYIPGALDNTQTLRRRHVAKRERSDRATRGL
eukprot:5235094-Alexandrium_andersonii.AAC.1